MYMKALPKLYIVQNMLELLIKAKLNCCGLVPYVFLFYNTKYNKWDGVI